MYEGPIGCCIDQSGDKRGQKTFGEVDQHYGECRFPSENAKYIGEPSVFTAVLADINLFPRLRYPYGGRNRSQEVS